jgi:chromosome segregation ATPase
MQDLLAEKDAKLVEAHEREEAAEINIEVLEQKQSSLLKTNEALKGALTDNQSKATEKDRIISEAGTRLTNTEAKVEVVTKQLNAQMSLNEGLEEEINGIRRTHAEVQEQLEKSLTELKTQSDAMNDKQKELMATQALVASMESKLVTLEAAHGDEKKELLDSHHVELTSLRAEFERQQQTFEHDKEELTLRLVGMQEESDKLDDTNRELKDKITSLETTIVTLNEEKAALSVRMTSTIAMVDELKSLPPTTVTVSVTDASAVEAAMTQAKDMEVRYIGAREAFDQEKARALKAINESKKEIDELSNELKEVTEAKHVLEAQLSTSRAETVTAKGQWQSLADEHTRMSNRWESMQKNAMDDIASLRKKLEDATANSDIIKREHKELTEQVNKLTTSLHDAEASLSEARRKFAEDSSKMQLSMETSESLAAQRQVDADREAFEVSRLNGEMKNLRDHLVAAQNNERSMEAEMEAIKAEEERTHEEKEKLRDANVRLTKEILDVKQKNNELKQENFSLGGHRNLQQRIQHVTHVKQENDTLKVKCARLERDLRELRQQYGIAVEPVRVGDDDDARLLTDRAAAVHTLRHLTNSILAVTGLSTSTSLTAPTSPTLTASPIAMASAAPSTMSSTTAAPSLLARGGLSERRPNLLAASSGGLISPTTTSGIVDKENTKPSVDNKKKAATPTTASVEKKGSASSTTTTPANELATETVVANKAVEGLMAYLREKEAALAATQREIVARDRTIRSLQRKQATLAAVAAVADTNADDGFVDGATF